MSTETLKYETVDGVAWITIDRPHVLNALSRAVRAEVPRMIDRAAAEPEVAVVVITGAGNRAFSAGADITEFHGPQAPGPDETAGSSPRWHDAPSRCAKPVIAAINGLCLGGGLELALACDIRICCESATFALPEVGVGVIPGAGGTQRLARTVGLGAALSMILTAERIDARDAHRLGLVWRVVADDELQSEAQQLARRLAGHSALALETAKAAVYRGSDAPLEAGLAIEAELSARVVGSAEQVRRADAFAERSRSSNSRPS